MPASQEDMHVGIPKNPLNPWAWIFIGLAVVLNLILLPLKEYRWYYLAGDIALLWFVILWLRKSAIAARLLLFNFAVSFFAYQVAYIMNILERPNPLLWVINIGFGIYAGWAIFKLQDQYKLYLQKLNEENIQSLA